MHGELVCREGLDDPSPMVPKHSGVKAQNPKVQPGKVLAHTSLWAARAGTLSPARGAAGECDRSGRRLEEKSFVQNLVKFNLTRMILLSSFYIYFVLH